MDLSPIETAKRKRVAAKGWLTRVSKQLNDLLATETFAEVELEELIVDFENRLRILDETQSQVEELIEIEELEQDIETAVTFRSEKKTILTKAKNSFRNIRSRESISDDGRFPRAESFHDERGNGPTNTKLPTLQLEKFSWNYMAWPTFWDKFQAVADCCQIPEINKFTYLQSLLEGEAAAAIRGLSLTAGNYETAKDILQKRYGRPERIIFGHIQQLLKTNGSSSHENSTSVFRLWTLYDEIQTHVRSLKNLGVGGDEYGVFLTPLVLNRLPTSICLEWARIGEGKEGDLTFLLTFLYDEIRRRKRSQTLPAETPDTREKQAPASTASELFSNAGTHKSCAFCIADHYSDKGESDGETGILSQALKRALYEGHNFSCAKDMVEYFSKRYGTNRRPYILVPEIDRIELGTDVQTIPGTQKYHQFQALKEFVLQARKFACFCTACREGRPGQCVGPYTVHKCKPSVSTTLNEAFIEAPAESPVPNPFPKEGDMVKLTCRVHKLEKTYHAMIIEVVEEGVSFSVRFLQKSGTLYAYGRRGTREGGPS